MKSINVQQCLVIAVNQMITKQSQTSYTTRPLTITNLSEHYILFKMKTNLPDYFISDKGSDLIGPLESHVYQLKIKHNLPQNKKLKVEIKWYQIQPQNGLNQQSPSLLKKQEIKSLLGKVNKQNEGRKVITFSFLSQQKITNMDEQKQKNKQTTFYDLINMKKRQQQGRSLEKDILNDKDENVFLNKQVTKLTKENLRLKEIIRQLQQNIAQRDQKLLNNIEKINQIVELISFSIEIVEAIKQNKLQSNDSCLDQLAQSIVQMKAQKQNKQNLITNLNFEGQTVNFKLKNLNPFQNIQEKHQHTKHHMIKVQKSFIKLEQNCEQLAKKIFISLRIKQFLSLQRNYPNRKKDNQKDTDFGFLEFLKFYRNSNL